MEQRGLIWSRRKLRVKTWLLYDMLWASTIRAELSIIEISTAPLILNHRLPFLFSSSTYFEDIRKRRYCLWLRNLSILTSRCRLQLMECDFAKRSHIFIYQYWVRCRGLQTCRKLEREFGRHESWVARRRSCALHWSSSSPLWGLESGNHCYRRLWKIALPMEETFVAYSETP